MGCAERGIGERDTYQVRRVVTLLIFILVSTGSLAITDASTAVDASNGIARLAASPATGYQRVFARTGVGSSRTRGFSIRPGHRWLVRWSFNCRGVSDPAFAATALQGPHHKPVLGVVRGGRLKASGATASEVVGTFAYRIRSDCSWRLSVYQESSPVASDPFTSEAMTSFLNGRKGNVTASVYDVTSGTTYLYRPGVGEQSGSIVKVNILATLLWQLQTRAAVLNPDDLKTASGMIEDSDNNDATTLWNEIGGSQAVTHFDALAGMTGTTPDSEGIWGVTTTTALDQVELLKRVALENPLLDANSRAVEIGLMEHVVGYQRWGISAGPPADAIVALKNGWVPIVSDDWQVNSIGYVSGTGREYLIAVLTNADPNEQYGVATIEGMSSIIWSVLGLTR
jgi:beta-lactamase class A